MDFRKYTGYDWFDLTIGEYAFCMKGFIKTLVLPPFCDFDENSFFVSKGAGKIIAGNYRKDELERLIKNGRIDGVNICYYDVFGYKEDFSIADEEGFFVSPPLCESLDEEGNFVPLSTDIRAVDKSVLEFEQIPVTLVIPDTVETIEGGALTGLFGKKGIKKRCIILPERFTGTIDSEWGQGNDNRPEIIYY